MKEANRILMKPIFISEATETTLVSRHYFDHTLHMILQRDQCTVSVWMTCKAIEQWQVWLDIYVGIQSLNFFVFTTLIYYSGFAKFRIRYLLYKLIIVKKKENNFAWLRAVGIFLLKLETSFFQPFLYKALIYP